MSWTQGGCGVKPFLVLFSLGLSVECNSAVWAGNCAASKAKASRETWIFRSDVSCIGELCFNASIAESRIICSHSRIAENLIWISYAPDALSPRWVQRATWPDRLR